MWRTMWNIFPPGRVLMPRAGWWGERWMLLPNPMYGHWEANAVQRKWGEEDDLLRLQLRAGALSSQPKR